jgi:hypothetical protein
MIIDGKALGRLLNKVYVNGLINDCLLNVSDGVASVEAIDLSNSVFLSVSEDIKAETDFQVGLINIATLCRFLEDSSGDLEAEVKGNWFHVKDAKLGKMKFLLTEPDKVPTAVTETGSAEKLIEMYKDKNKVSVSKEALERFLYYQGLLKPSSVVFKVKNGVVRMKNNEIEPQQFDFQFGKLPGEFQVEVYASHFLGVLKSSDTATMSFYLAEGKPVLIKDGDNCWAFYIFSRATGSFDDRE